MLPLRYARRWQTASVVLLIIVLTAALMPPFSLWNLRVPALGWLGAADKCLHVMTFTVLSLWFAGLYRRRAYWRIACGLLAFGMFIELCQSMVHRDAEWLDVAADGIGILIGLTIAVAGIGRWSLLLENRLSQREP